MRRNRRIDHETDASSRPEEMACSACHRRPPPEPPEAASRLWRELAGAPDALVPGTTTVVRGSRGLCPPGWTGVVRLGDAYVIEAGDASDDVLGRLAALEEPSDPARVTTALRPTETLGPGELAYLPERGTVADPQLLGELSTTTPDEIGSWLASLPPADVTESAVDEMAEVVVLRRAGAIVGAAGHHDWPAGVAHIGVVVAPRSRGSGVGVQLGAAATRRALDLGLHPQWRAATWNTASRSVAARIGYVEFGRQFSFRL